MEELVSVILTTYNRCDILPRCLDSVLSQNYNNMEILVINDNSSDNTKKIIKKYQSKDSRIKYYEHKKNRGNAATRNTGVKNVSGKYVAFMDDDDEWIDENKLKKQVNIFENNDEGKIGIICTSINLVDEKRNIEQKVIKRPYNFKERILKKNGIIYSPTVMTRKSILQQTGGFDERFPRGVDSDFYRMVVFNYGYDVYFLEDITTSIHEYGNDRMTPTDSEKAIYKNIITYRTCLAKYKKEFEKRKSAKYFRKKRIVKDYIKLLSINFKLAYIKELIKSLFI